MGVTTRGPKPGCELSFGQKCWAMRSDLLNTGGSRRERNPVACVTSASRQRLDSRSCIWGHLSQLFLLLCFSTPHPQGPAAFRGIKGTCFSWDFGTGGVGSATESLSFMSLSSFSSEAGKEQVQGIYRASSQVCPHPTQPHLGLSLMPKFSLAVTRSFFG